MKEAEIGSYTDTNRETPRIAGNDQKKERNMGQILSLRPQEGINPAYSLISDF